MTPILGIMASQISGHLTPPSSFESIATVTAAGGETSLSFTSIPGTYKSLQIRGIAKSASTSDNTTGLNLRFNSDTASNYWYHVLRGSGSTADAFNAGTTSISIYGGAIGNTTSNLFGAFILDVIDYASTTKYKTTRAFAGNDSNNAGANHVALDSGLWSSTSAINSIQINAIISHVAGTTFALYGIKG